MQHPDPARLRVVLDAMIYLQALLGPTGPAAGLLQLGEAGRFDILVSRDVMQEVSGLLKRPRTLHGNPEITADKIAVFVQGIEDISILMDDVPEAYHYPRDVDDEPYINLAIAAGADFLVSRDRDLLDLMDESAPEGQDFRARFPGVRIVGPVAFLRTLREDAT